MKPWYQSKTFLYGLLVALIPAVDALAHDAIIGSNPIVLKALLAASGIMTILLRTITDKPLK